MSKQGNSLDPVHVAETFLSLGYDENYIRRRLMLRKRETKKKALGFGEKEATAAIEQAQVNIMTRLALDYGEHRARSYQVYLDILRNPKASNKDKVAAQARIDRLMGLDTPSLVQISGPNGGPIQHEMDLSALTTDELLRFRQVFQRSGSGVDEPSRN